MGLNGVEAPFGFKLCQNAAADLRIISDFLENLLGTKAILKTPTAGHRRTPSQSAASAVTAEAETRTNAGIPASQHMRICNTCIYAKA